MLAGANVAEPASLAGDLVKRLRRALIGRGLVVVTSQFALEFDDPPFDMLIRFGQGSVVDRQDRRARKPAELEVL